MTARLRIPVWSVINFYVYQVPHVAGGAPLLLYISPTCRPLSFWKPFVAGGAAHAVALGWAFAMVEMPEYEQLPDEPTPGWFCQNQPELVLLGVGCTGQQGRQAGVSPGRSPGNVCNAAFAAWHWHWHYRSLSAMTI